MCTRTSRTPFTLCRSRATGSTFLPRASCASIAAARAATNGRRSPRACRSRTATSTCCATRWLSTRSINAASISALPAARCTLRRTRAKVDGEVTFEIEGPVTPRSVLDALEARYPVLQGAIRDHVTKKRRPFIRFFACEEDLSHEPPDAPLPDAVVKGAEPFLVVGAIAGGL